jgi:hypothetical protein
MSACATCNTTILFGGVKDGDTRFCNENCHANGYLVFAARQIPPAIVRQTAESVYYGMCPKCEGPGPVDVHTSHRVWSFLLLTSWKSTPRVTCRRCGVKSQVGNAIFSFFLGWWGFPWGFVMTPVQLTRNLTAIFRTQTAGPSPELERMIGLEIAADAIRGEQSASLA